MQIDQIILRPAVNLIVLQHIDAAARTSAVLIDVAGLDVPQSGAFAALVDLCQKRLPPEPDKPPLTEVEQEIVELEYRLQQLRTSIGVAVVAVPEAPAEQSTPSIP